jgi:mannosyltransferase
LVGSIAPLLPARLAGGSKFGKSEIVMRIPSLIAMGIATVFLYYVGKRLCDATTGILAMIAFVNIKEVVFAAADARPYALTMMLLLGHVLLLLRWLDTGKLRDAVGCALLAALTAYGHIVLAVGLAVPALYAFWRTQWRGRLVLIWLTAAVLAAPLLPQILTFGRESSMHAWLAVPGIPNLLEMISPPPLVTAAAAGVFLAFLLLPPLSARWRPAKPDMVLVVAWALFPVFLFFY